MSALVLGIDPGKASGLAVYTRGKLASLATCTPGELVAAITRIAPSLVVFEDSRLQSPTWGRGVSRAALLKVARNVGQIDGWCALIEEASDLGAARALARLGLADEKAAKDMAELRELLSAWRDAKVTVRKAVLGWVVRGCLALLLLGLAVKLGLAGRVAA